MLNAGARLDVIATIDLGAGRGVDREDEELEKSDSINRIPRLSGIGADSQ
ncbi:MAG: hypothetical protein NXI18_03325 [Alphaproteobacteria bacterium]|nr:hypothetical protein [Alphaproteobacteria bacterium]